MQQLTKIHRVIGKQIPEAPHEVLLVLDATTGQNGISQAKHFTEAVHCTGIVLAKLDGTAKGGVVVAIRQQVGLPVKYVGVGEQPEDLALVRARRVRRSPVRGRGRRRRRVTAARFPYAHARRLSSDRLHAIQRRNALAAQSSSGRASQPRRRPRPSTGG